MVNIIFLLLKIIGIIIASIIGIVLVLILLVLFVPIRYKVRANNKEKPVAHGTIAWLLHIITVDIFYTKEEVSYKIRILGFTLPMHKEDDKNKKTDLKIKRTLDKEKNRKKTEGEEYKQKVSLENREDIKIVSTNVTRELKEEIKQEEIKQEEIKQEEIKQEEIKQEEIKQEEIKQEENRESDFNKEETFQEEPKLNPKKGKKHFIQKIISSFKNGKFTLRTFYDKIISRKNKIVYILNLLKSDTTKKAISLCKKQLMKILHMLAPKVFMLQLDVGLEDPYLLGELLAGYSALYPIHKGKIRLIPYFDEIIFKFTLFVRGRIFIVTLLRVAIILYFDKNIKKLIKEFNKEEK